MNISSLYFTAVSVLHTDNTHSIIHGPDLMVIVYSFQRISKQSVYFIISYIPTYIPSMLCSNCSLPAAFSPSSLISCVCVSTQNQADFVCIFSSFDFWIITTAARQLSHRLKAFHSVQVMQVSGCPERRYIQGLHGKWLALVKCQHGLFDS